MPQAVLLVLTDFLKPWQLHKGASSETLELLRSRFCKDLPPELWLQHEASFKATLALAFDF